MVELYEHQKLGKKYLLDLKKACLFFEVGTGKTFTALSAITELPKGLKVLIVAPKRVLEHVWKVDKTYDLSDWDVTYLNYEKIARDKTIMSKWFDCIVLDEVHKIKGKTTNTSTRIKALAKKARYVWGLTGTPVANNYADIYNIYKNMDIVEFSMSYNQFCTEYYYCRPLEKGIYTIPILIAPKSLRIPELLARIGRHSLTKKAVDCIDLPEKKTIIHKLEGMDSKKYKEIESGIYDMADDTRTMLKLEAINKAHQAANGFVYNSIGFAQALKTNIKDEYLVNLVSTHLEESNKIIIVYQYRKDLDTIKDILSEEDFSVTTDVAEFEKDSQILLLQFGQAEGLNLQFCNTMIFYTYDYSFLKFDQMCGRIYRSGQRNNVTYHILINTNTIEDKIWWAINNKKTTDEFLKGALTNGQFTQI